MYTSFFGTDGIRTKFGTSPLTPLELLQLGYVLGYWITNIQHKRSIAIGHDTRISCPLLKAALKTGLLQHNVTIYDSGIVPTPTLYYAVKQQKAYDIGIMITASHNEYQDNGIKIMTQDHGKLTVEDEQIIMNLYYSLSEKNNFECLGTDIPDSNLLYYYMHGMITKFSSNFLEGIKIIIDCAHGSTLVCATEIFETLGATVITLNDKPTGKNINKKVGSQHPEIIKQAVITNMAHIGFAFDGDGDRLTVVSHQGTVKDGDDIVTVLLDHPAYKHESTIVGTIMSNQGFEKHIETLGKKLIRTPVGDRNVMHAMTEHNALLGAETSGHVLLKDFSGTADGIFTALRLLEAIILTGNWNIDSFKKYTQCIMNIPITIKKDLSQEPYATLIKNTEEKFNNGRIIVRYSGTEPVLRIMTEGPDPLQTQIVTATLSQELSAIFEQEIV